MNTTVQMSQNGITDGTMTDRKNTFELVVDYDERFEEQVENGDPNPLADLTIRVGEYDLTGHLTVSFISTITYISICRNNWTRLRTSSPVIDAS